MANVIDIYIRSHDQTRDGVESAGKSGSVLTGIFQGIGQAAGNMLADLPGKAIGFFGSAISAASDLGETISKNQTIFGAASKDLLVWAETAPKSLGMTKQAALDATGMLGNMFTQLGVGADQARKMSQSTVQLASDFASFHNADPTEVLDAVSAAYRGEYDAVQKYVPMINAAKVEEEAMAMTHKASKDALTDKDKALAVDALLMKGAGAAAGDFARTSGGAANQTRIAGAMFEDLKVKIGQGLLPIWTSLLTFVTGSFVPGLMSLGDSLQPVFTFLQLVADGVKLLFAAFMGSDVSVSELFPPEVADVLLNIGSAARQLADTVMTSLAGAFESARTAVQPFWDALNMNQAVLIGVAAVLGSLMVVAVVSLTTALWGMAAGVIAATWPFVAIGLAVAAVAAAVMYAYNNWEWFRVGVQTVVGWLITFVPPAFEMVRAAIALAFEWVATVAIPFVVAAFGSFIGFLQNTLLPAVVTVWNAVYGAIETAVNFIRPIIDFLVLFIQENFGHIAEIAMNIWDMIRNIIANAWQIISNLIQLGLNLITGNWGAAWENVKNILSAVWDTIRNVVSNGIGVVRELLQGILSFVGSIAGRIAEGLINAGRSMIEGLWNGINEKIGWVKDKISGALSSVRNLFPFSPAKEGPFSGRGYTSFSGQHLAEDFAGGMLSGRDTIKRAASALMQSAKPYGLTDAVAELMAAVHGGKHWFEDMSFEGMSDAFKAGRWNDQLADIYWKQNAGSDFGAGGEAGRAEATFGGMARGGSVQFTGNTSDALATVIMGLVRQGKIQLSGSFG